MGKVVLIEFTDVLSKNLKRIKEKRPIYNSINGGN